MTRSPRRAGAPGPLVFAPSGEVTAFVVHALRRHRELWARNGMAVPAGVDDLVAVLGSSTSSANERHGAPPGADAGPGDHGGHVPPLLLTYQAAAKALAISTRSLNRRIAAGDLRPVVIGGARRIRATDIDDLVARLATRIGGDT